MKQEKKKLPFYRTWECWDCGITMDIQVVLDTHSQRLSGEEKVWCPICGKQFSCGSEAKPINPNEKTVE